MLSIRINNISFTYERDLVLWAQATAELLREQCWEAIDLAHLIESELV